MSEKLPTAFADIPQDAYPFVIIAYLMSSGREVWRETMPGPGALHVPPLAKRHGEPVGIRIEFANGDVTQVGAQLDRDETL